ncbi:MAG: tripartite tricarboxylate transporter permease [Thermotogaceae bacterium]|nr:tripartite tricarboxylate transporter permease [Thermotogaceae bacterium]
MEILSEVIKETLNFQTLIWLCGGTIVGIILGALPGLTATMGLTLMIPVSYYLPMGTAMGLLLGVYLGAVLGASIPAILLGIPGNPNAIATVYDGFEMTKKGEGGKALGGAIIASFFGGIISLILLVFLAPQIARIALMFGPPEYFALAVFGLTIIASVSGKDFLKGLIMATLGIMLSMVGLDNMTGIPRFTFGSVYLLDGIPLIPALIGLYAFGQVFSDIGSLKTFEKIKEISYEKIRLKDLFPSLNWKNFRIIVESSLIGAGIGAFPGTGASIAVFIAYSRAKKRNKEVGSGVLEGVMAPEAANNGVTGGTLIPTLALGIPGDAAGAVILSALIIKGVQPGPLLFKYNIRTVYTIFFMLFLANITMVVFQLVGIRMFIKMLSIPSRFLIPAILIFSTVGSFALRERISDVLIALAFGIAGYFLSLYKFPKAPLLLGLILGPIVEPQFRRSMMLFQGDWIRFFTRPISLSLFILTALTIAMTFLKRRKGQRS